MPAHAPMTDREPELLSGYLSQQLRGVKASAFGLTDEQLRATPLPSALSIGAILRHIAHGIAGWLDRIAAAPKRWDPQVPADAQAAYYNDFQWADGETGDSIRAELDALIERVGAEVPRLDLEVRVPVPSDAPWWPKDVTSWSVRWVLLHLVEETARHAGHADLIREAIDGATMYALLAGVEGWPATDWLTPWSPTAERPAS